MRISDWSSDVCSSDLVFPMPVSVRDSDRVLGLLSSKTHKVEKGEGRVKEHLVLTRYNPARVAKGEMLSIDDVKEILAIPLLGVVPESPAVLTSSNADRKSTRLNSSH